MARTLYKYNTKTRRYEVATENRRKKTWQRVSSFAFSLGLALAAFSFYTQYSYSVSEWWLNSRNNVLKKEYDFLFERTFYANRQLDELITNDDDNYRVILDSSPLPKTVRAAGIGGSEKLSLPQGENFPIILTNYQRLDKLKRQVEIEEQSLAEKNTLLNETVQMWASRPAIQPIDNRQLDQLHLTYGLRLHPIFNTLKDHKGLDFAAPRGTPVYATGDGKIQKANFSGTYGNVVYINHNHGFVFNNNGIYRGTDVNPTNGPDAAPTVFVKDSRYEKMMEAFGGVGAYATSPDELSRAVIEALESGKPTLVNAIIDEKAGTESGRIGNLNPQSVVAKK
jgi:hypothetical protein